MLFVVKNLKKKKLYYSEIIYMAQPPETLVFVGVHLCIQLWQHYHPF